MAEFELDGFNRPIDVSSLTAPRCAVCGEPLFEPFFSGPHLASSAAVEDFAFAPVERTAPTRSRGHDGPHPRPHEALARPVMQRHLRVEHAYAAIAAAVARADRLGELEGSAEVDEQIDRWAWIHGEFLRREDSLVRRRRGEIRAALRPLIAVRRPPTSFLPKRTASTAQPAFPSPNAK